MKAKICKMCGGKAHRQIIILMSTVGEVPRRQQTTSGVHLCNSCLSFLTIVSVPSMGDIIRHAADALTVKRE